MSPTPSPLVAPSGAPSPSPAAKAVTLSCDGTCTPDQKAELPAIEDALNTTLTSSCFNTYFNTPGRRIDLTNNLSPPAIVQKLHTPAKLTVNYFYAGWPSKEEGFEDASDYSTIHFNYRFTDTWSICEVASLAGHEYSHTQAFYHNGNKAPPNYYTVPYQVNNSFEGNDDMAACCLEKLAVRHGGLRGTGHPRRVLELRRKKLAAHRHKIPLHTPPKSHRHATVGRCLNNGKWIPGCK